MAHDADLLRLSPSSVEGVTGEELAVRSGPSLAGSQEPHLPS